MPPYFDDFSDPTTRDLWTVVNANNDASNWGSEYTWSFNDYNSCWGIYTGPTTWARTRMLPTTT